MSEDEYKQTIAELQQSLTTKDRELYEVRHIMNETASEAATLFYELIELQKKTRELEAEVKRLRVVGQARQVSSR